MQRFVGIDVARRTHLVAIVGETMTVLVKPTPVTEDSAGYEKLIALVGSPADSLIVMEATGHYWRNLFVYLCARDFRCAVVNPLRIRRFAQEDLRRAKTDRTDALTIARFGAQKRPEPTPSPDPVLDDFRELVRLRERLGQDFGDHLRQLHRLLVLVFPEFPEIVRTLESQRATALLRQYPSAEAFRQADERDIARLRCDGRRRLGAAIASSLVTAANTSVAQHHSAAYDVSVRTFCADIDLLRQSLHDLELAIQRSVGGHAAPVSQLGNAELRASLWMPTLTATKRNAWLRAYYERLVARGKPRKLAMVAAMRKLLTAVYSVAKSRRPFVARLDA